MVLKIKLLVLLRQLHLNKLYERGKKLSKPKAQNKIRNPFILKKKKKEIKDRIIRDVWTLFETEKQKKERKELEKKKEINERLIIDRILYWKKFLREDIFAVSRKIGAIREIKFPRKIVFWTIREKKISKNKFQHFLFSYLFQLMTTTLYNTT